MVTTTFDFDAFSANGFFQSHYDIDPSYMNSVVFDCDTDGVYHSSCVDNHAFTQYKNTIRDIIDLLKQTYNKVTVVTPEDSAKIWDGVEDSSCEWHNDAPEGGNMLVLLYLDDTVIDGSISFRCNGERETRIFPKRGYLLFVSNSLQFQHKAERSVNPRRIVGFTLQCELV